ncbi:MFS general substrate transporter [Mollisia scopiformis]|uniref:MFS general substrate transporter n=1 Tax=Mollisia scopiformis TaxID=149040 RepID=A0A194XU76_MOLSC|nr:MFS general substrate transporter [Mollisia scopiformis]KUJ23691.1 MFS general substrate transporter [Mollisia scopiformis]
MTDERTLLLENASPKNSVFGGDVNIQEALQKDIPETDEEKKLLRKIDLRLMPIIWVMYILNFVDRTNIGNAKIAGMPGDLGLDDSQFAWALSVFFVGYLMMEVPSFDISPSYHVGLGCSQCCHGWYPYLQGIGRFPVRPGCIEAGFFPGVLYLLYCWYKPAEIGKRFAIFFSAAVLAGAFGGLLAGAITQKIADFHGISSWRWLFIIEGVATVCVAIVAKFILFDFPSTSPTLSLEERQLTTVRLLAAGVESSSHHDGNRLNHWQAFVATVSDYRTFLFMFICVCIIGAATIQFFIPTITVALGYETVAAQYMTIPIYIIAAIFLNIAAVSADRLQERRWHVTISLALACSAAVVCVIVTNPIVRYIMLCFVVSGIWTSIPLVFAWMSEIINIPAEKRAVCLALVNSVANLSSVFGSRLWPSSTAPHYTFGWAVTAGCLGFAAVTAVLIPVVLKSIPPYVTKAERELQDRKDAMGADAQSSEA